MALKYSRVGKVTIGDNVFIGADSIILPAITIGNNVVVGTQEELSSHMMSL